MKFTALVSFLASISLRYGVNANDSPAALRGSMENNRRALRMQHPCTLISIETQLESELEENSGSSRDRMYNGSRRNGGARSLYDGAEQIVCELQEDDRMAVGKFFVPFSGIEFSKYLNIKSGVTTFMSEGAMILDGVMFVPDGAAFEFGSNEPSNRRLETSRTHGIKKVLVVRADAKDSETTADKKTLSDKFFGTYGDTATLKSQYLACSHGKLDFQPFQGTTIGGAYIENGVLDVTIDMKVASANRYDVADAIEDEADRLVGGLRDQFDHVMLCLPPGIDGWIAYGYVNSWLSVYNDHYCKSMSTMVHEIGHNLGLAHSGKDGSAYADKSGMMGYSYNLDDGPLQCFNPAKTYQLGWFDDKQIEIDPTDGTWVGTVIGAADYANAIVDPNAKVVVKIKSGDDNDLYIGYNRKKSMNSEVSLGGDLLSIVEQGEGYSKSNYLAGLSEEETKTFYKFGDTNKNLVVEFVGRNSDDEAIVAIYFDDCVFPECIARSPAASPTEAPQPPTEAPVPPTSPPSRQPTLRPTTAEPTLAPVIAKPTPRPTRKRMYNISYNSSRNRRKELLNESFRADLGVFNVGANQVKQNVYQWINTAKFELKESSNLPSMYTNVNLYGTSSVQVSFWYNAETMQNGEGFKLQYSTNYGSTWTDARNFVFGEGDFDQIEKWNSVKSETFEVTQGIPNAQIRFVGETETNNSDSVFYIAGVNVYGVMQ